MKPVFIELKKPSGDHLGHVVQGFYSLDGDTVILVGQFGDPKTDADGKTYRRKLAENQNPGKHSPVSVVGCEVEQVAQRF